ncbi:MAG: ankyrin repeat domain-containing protein [bacterium]|nr:ankyrin repeat domain-containing protein [bacterium]
MKIKKLFIVGLFNLLFFSVLPADAIKLTAEDITKIREKHPSSSLLLKSICESEEVLIQTNHGYTHPFALFLLMDEFWADEVDSTFRMKLLDFFTKKRAAFLLNARELININGQTLLMLAAKNSHFHLLFLHLLKNRGFDLFQKDFMGNTFMHFAAEAGLVNNLFALITLDADHVLVNEANSLGQTPLMLTVLANQPEAVAMLLAHGATATMRLANAEGFMAIDLAEQIGNPAIIVQLNPHTPEPLPDDDMICDGESAHNSVAVTTLPPPAMFVAGSPPSRPGLARPSPQRSPPRPQSTPQLPGVAPVFFNSMFLN